MLELTDTDPHAREVWLDLLRNMRPEERLAQALRLSELALRVSEAGVRLAYPQASEREVFLRAASRRLTHEQMIGAYGGTRSQMSSPAEVLGKFLAVLDRLEIPYVIGGSVASSLHGVPRMTLDAIWWSI